MKLRTLVTCGLLAAGWLTFTGCGRQESEELRGPIGIVEPAPTRGGAPAPATAHAGHDHDHTNGDGHDHAHAAPSARPGAGEPDGAALAAHDAPPPAAAPAPAQARASEWTEPADRLTFHLDYHMVDQDGRSLTLAELRGQPVALTFFFTRCPSPNMCPLIISSLASLQQRLAANGLGAKVRLAAISYDPTYDTPERMKRYGTHRGLSFDNAQLLRPDGDQFRELLTELGVGMALTPTGQINHYIELILMDRHGRFVRDYQGEVWDEAAVAADLRKLAAEE